LRDTIASTLGAHNTFVMREVVRHGSAAAELADLSKGADLLVVSGTGGVTRLLGGAVTETAGCPLLVIQPTTPAPPAH